MYIYRQNVLYLDYHMISDMVEYGIVHLFKHFTWINENP